MSLDSFNIRYLFLNNLAGNEAGQLFGQINFEELLEDERDNLYTTEYIMRMFTCETSALEGMYAMGRERLTEEQRSMNVYQVKTKNGTELELAPGNADKLYSLDWDKTKHTWGVHLMMFPCRK